MVQYLWYSTDLSNRFSNQIFKWAERLDQERVEEVEVLRAEVVVGVGVKKGEVRRRAGSGKQLQRL